MGATEADSTRATSSVGVQPTQIESGVEAVSGATTTKDREAEKTILDPVSGLWYSPTEYDELLVRRRHRRLMFGDSRTGHDAAVSMNYLGI